jgi:RHS repeat-associated protein
MDYNKAGSITFKNGNGSSFMNATALTYGLEYNYDPSKDHQLDHIWDPASGTNTTFTYNTSGSITRINDPSQAIPQDFFWNEQQQLTGVKNQQGVHHYVYDHQGERLMKSSLINTSVYLNDQVIDNVTNLDPYTVYVNPFYVVTGLLGGDRVSKHYYMNQQRVATDITINYDPNGGGGGEYASSKGLDDLKEVVQELSHEPLDTSVLTLPSLTDYYPETATAKSSSSQAEGAGSSGRILFWYHPDYLGNVDLVTEIDGFAHEFFIYNPWGEEMHQWNANTYAFTSPYRFNSKELDPETGLAYYGARYYQNKLGVWLSVDPKAGLMLTLSPYAAMFNNPILFIDPDGQYPWPVHVRSFISTSTTGGGLFRGDGRGASFTGTSRVYSSFIVDPSARRVSQPLTQSDLTLFYGSPNPLNPMFPLLPSAEQGKPTGSNDNISFEGNTASFDFRHSGKDPITPQWATPGLDIHAGLSFSEDLENRVLSVTGSFTGDVFPSIEAFITDQSGKTRLFLGAQKERGGLLSLFGDNKNPLFNVNMQVHFDNNGYFTGVKQGKKTYSVDEWNKKVQKEFDQ